MALAPHRRQNRRPRSHFHHVQTASFELQVVEPAKRARCVARQRAIRIRARRQHSRRYVRPYAQQRRQRRIKSCPELPQRPFTLRRLRPLPTPFGHPLGGEPAVVGEFEHASIELHLRRRQLEPPGRSNSNALGQLCQAPDPFHLRRVRKVGRWRQFNAKAPCQRSHLRSSGTLPPRAASFARRG